MGVHAIDKPNRDLLWYFLAVLKNSANNLLWAKDLRPTHPASLQAHDNEPRPFLTFANVGNDGGFVDGAGAQINLTHAPLSSYDIRPDALEEWQKRVIIIQLSIFHPLLSPFQVVE